MGSKHFRTVHDVARHCYDIELRCYCAHKAVLRVTPVVERFVRANWPIGPRFGSAPFPMLQVREPPTAGCADRAVTKAAECLQATRFGHSQQEGGPPKLPA
jgi:hypothetical protein